MDTLIEAIESLLDWTIEHPAAFVGHNRAKILEALNSLRSTIQDSGDMPDNQPANHIEDIHSGNRCEKSSALWAQKTIEQGLRNIVGNAFADRVS